jgi:hypothetical protein
MSDPIALLKTMRVISQRTFPAPRSESIREELYPTLSWTSAVR